MPSRTNSLGNPAVKRNDLAVEQAFLRRCKQCRIDGAGCLRIHFGFQQYVLDTLETGRQRPEIGAFPHAGDGAQPLPAFHRIVPTHLHHRVDFIVAKPLLPEEETQSVLKEVPETPRGFLPRSIGKPANSLVSLAQHSFAGKVQLFCQQDADHPQGLAAQPQGVPRSRGNQAQAEGPRQRVQFVGQGNNRPAQPARYRVFRANRQVVIVYGLRNSCLDALDAGVEPPHDSLQIAEFPDHLGSQIGLAQLGGLLHLRQELGVPDRLDRKR